MSEEFDKMFFVNNNDNNRTSINNTDLDRLRINTFISAYSQVF
jgi:hypothetical protein